MKVKNYFIHLWNNHQLRHMLMVAVTLMLILANGESKPPDWQNFIGVVILVVFNSILSFQLVDSTNQVGHLQDVSTLIAIFCICLEVGAIMLMISIMYPIQHKRYRQGIEDLIVIFMGGFVITMPNMLFVIMAMGMNWLSEQGAIIKSYTSIEDIARMDIPCTDMTGTLTSSDLKVLKTFIKVFGDEVEEDDVLPKAARASRIGIAVLGETDAARSAADIILTVPDLTVPDLNVIFKVVLSSRVILQRMKSYAIYAVAITTFLVPGFMLLVLIWGFSFPPFLVLIIAIISNVTIVLIAKDMVNPSPLPDSLKFAEIFATGIILGSYLATTTHIFFWATYKTSFFPWIFRVPTLEKTALDHDDIRKLVSAIYLQVSIISQALIFVTRSRSWSYVERRPGLCHVVVFVVTGLGATLFAVYANGSFAAIEGIGWGWAGVIWLYNIILYITLDFIKLFVRYALTWRVWDPVKIAIISLIDFLNDYPELQSTG